ncbi:MAG: hypothetical protein CMO55_22000 [Verrucomicrobiales bacterium]|nr:hypothetical protein [Verrucomicrobiales bacterium]
MFQKLVSHNEDLNRLVEKGYAISFDEGYLVIRDIPYLNDQKELRTGAIVTKLVFVNDNEVRQDNHQIFFAGSIPCGLDGKIIPNLGNRETSLPLGSGFSDVVVQRSFSNKPRRKKRFDDFYEKIESYVTIISGPAIELHDVDPYTYNCEESFHSDSVFRFHDTMTSRAEITDLSTKLKEDVIAIIGLGGTGSYILDYLAKVPAREIRLFDVKPYHVHNAFRSPGRLGKGELGLAKAEVYKSRYDNFRTGIFHYSTHVDSSNDEEFEEVTFAFVCVDKGSSRSGIFDLLIEKGIPFIDVGMGLNRKKGPIDGMLRVTYYSAERSKELREMGLAEINDQPEDIYRANIQISELNALNAALAVIRFKQLRGFYSADPAYEHALFTIADLHNTGDEEVGDED